MLQRSSATRCNAAQHAVTRSAPAAPGPRGSARARFAVLLDLAHCAVRRSLHRLKYAPTTRPCGAP